MKVRKNHRESQFRYLEKGALALCRATTTKPRQIERSSFFLLDHNGQTRVYRLVSGPFDVLLRRKHDSPMEEDDCTLSNTNGNLWDRTGPTLLNSYYKKLIITYFSIFLIKDLSAPTICQTFALMLFVQVRFCLGKIDTQSNVIASYKQSIIAVDFLGLCGE